MAIEEGKERVMITLSKDVLARIDKLAARFNMTRSEVLTTSFEEAEDTLQLLDTLKLSPENLRAISNAVKAGVRAVVEPLVKGRKARAKG